MRARDRRLGRVKDAIDGAPVQRHLLREEYGWFRDWGELSDDDHMAYEVVAQALRGGKEEDLTGNIPFHKRERPGEQWPPSVRAMLFDEALDPCPPLRRLARAAIATEVAWGGDVENPGFAARHGIPAYGSVAMHVVGWPRRLTVPPYQDQARRLLVRLDNVRGRIDHEDPRWLKDQANAIVAFWRADRRASNAGRHTGDRMAPRLGRELRDLPMQLAACRRSREQMPHDREAQPCPRILAADWLESVAVFDRIIHRHRSRP